MSAAWPAGPYPFASVQKALRHGNFDEIIVSTLPRRVSKWLRRDLIRRIVGLGLPVTAIVPRGGRLSNKQAFQMMIEPGPGGGPG